MNLASFAEGIGRRGCFVISALACASVMVAPLQAQTSLGVGPLIGYYRPLGQFDQPSQDTRLPVTPSGLSGFAWGGNARLWFGRSLGVEATAMLATSMVGKGLTPVGPSPARPAQVLILSAEVLYDFSPVPARYRAWVDVGPGLVRHSGGAYAEVGSFVDPAGILGAGASVRLSPHLAAAGELGTAFYWYDVPIPYDQRLNPGELQSGFQEDLSLCVSLEWTLG